MVSIESYIDLSQGDRNKMGATFSNWKNDEMMVSKYRQTKSNWKDKGMNNTKTGWKERGDSRLEQGTDRATGNAPKQASQQRNSITNTRSNWREQSSKPRDRQGQRDSQEAIQRSSVNKENTQKQDLVTLDKFFGLNFKPVTVEVAGLLEGSEPPKYLDQDLEQYMEEEFEINETDEDMYSESNTLTNFNRNSMMSHRHYKVSKDRSIETQGKTSFLDDNRSINNETVAVDADEKIKRKIIEKYSKNPRHNKNNIIQMQKSEGMPGKQQKYLDISKLYNCYVMNSQGEQELPQKKGPTVKSHQNITPEIQQVHRRNECNSQSPGKNDPMATKSDSQHQAGFRGSLTNFYQKYGKTNSGFSQYESKTIENHIAFRNSFYANNQKSNLENYPDVPQPQKTQSKVHRDVMDVRQAQSIGKVDNTAQLQGPPDLSKFTDMAMNSKPNKFYNQKDKINEIKMREQDKFNKYASRFNLNKSDLRDRSLESAKQRMQTPTLYFRSDFKKE